MAQQTQQRIDDRNSQQQRLTPEQLKKLQEEFEKLPPEKKAELLQQNCIFCQIAQGKIESVKLYEDSQIIAVLDIMPFTEGHTLIMPKRHFQFLFQLPEDLQRHIINVTNKLSTYIINATKANGFNLLVSNGLVAGQNIPHIAINLIPRFQEDGINFDFERKRSSKHELEKIASQVREKFKTSEEKKKESKKVVEDEEQEIARQFSRLRRRLP